MIHLDKIKSYTINLDKYKYKYNKCLKRLSPLNIKPDRFDAIYINNENDQIIKNITYPSVQYIIKNGRYSHNNIGTKGAIGCYLSHVTLWKMLIDSNEDMFLIFEDDVDINSITNYKLELNKFLNSVSKEDWDFIFLGYFTIKDSDNNEKENKLNYKKIDNITLGLHAYIINRKGAEKLLNNAFPIVDQLDSYISFMAINRNVNCYKPKNISFFYQNNDQNTTIQTDFALKPYITQYDDSVILSIIMFILLLIILLIILHI
jgi:GR25 family glycosyltransferase involved in LPS biosynthesis